METKALEKDFQKPMDLLKKRRQYYRSINVRIATVRVGDVWHNIRTRVLLTCWKTTYKSQAIPEADNFKIQFEIQIQKLQNLLVITGAKFL